MARVILSNCVNYWALKVLGGICLHLSESQARCVICSIYAKLTDSWLKLHTYTDMRVVLVFTLNSQRLWMWAWCIVSAHSSITLCLNWRWMQIHICWAWGLAKISPIPEKFHKFTIPKITHLLMQICMCCISTPANTNTHLHEASPSLSTHTPPLKQWLGWQGLAARASLCFGASGLISTLLSGFSSVTSLVGAAGSTGTSVLIRWVKSNETTG